MSRGRALGLALAAAGFLALVLRDASDERRVMVAALESDELAALAARAGARLPDVWARAKLMGVGAAVLRPQPLEDAVRRGEVLIFSRAEVERWKAAGLLSPEAALRPDTLWTKDAGLYEQLLQASARQGVAPTTTTMAGFHVIETPAGRELELSGYDPERVSAASGLTALYADGSARTLPSGSGLEPASWRVGSSRGALLRRAFSHPRRLLVLRLDMARGLEENFDAVRSALRELARRGAALAPAAPAREEGPKRSLRLAFARAGAWLLALLAPLFAARCGLVAMRRLRERVLTRWPLLAPVVPIAGGMAATATLAAFSGAVLHALAGETGGALSARWAFGALAGPLAVAALTLYTIDLKAWSARVSRPATYAELLKLAAIAAAAALLLAPRWTLTHLGVWSTLRAAGGALPAPWWWSWRWRELLIGYPCLVQALLLIHWRLDCPDCAALPASPANDPRGWFMLGLLAPIGVVVAVGQAAVPQALALGQGLETFAAGSLLGAALVTLRLRVAHKHAKRPKDPLPL